MSVTDPLPPSSALEPESVTRRAGDALAALLTAAVMDAARRDPVDDGTCLTVDETADKLRVHRNTVDKLIRDGDLPAIRVGRSVRIRLVDLCAYQEQAVVS